MKRDKLHLPLPPTDIITVVIFTVAVFFLLAFGGKVLEAYRLQRHNALLRAEAAALQEEQKQLQARREYVQTPEYVEKTAREQFKWVKPGEKLVITTFRKPSEVGATPTPPASESSPTAAATMLSASAAHWSEWWRLLAGPFD
jgi:cell division protein FtsB